MTVEQSTTDSVRVPLRARDGSVKAYTLIDLEDAEWVNQWRWHLAAFGYAVRGDRSGGKFRMVLLHRSLLALTPGDGLDGDHINRNRLDNRRDNLRIVTRAQNLQNVSSRAGATSNHRGVSWDKSRGLWRATIQISGHWQQLGRFTSEDEAARAARDARERLMPFSID